jgi:hypothetical protein
LIVCSIVCLNDLKIAAGDRVGAHGDASWTYCRIHVGELWNEDFSFKSVKVSRVRCYCLLCMAVCSLARNLFQSEQKYLFGLYIGFKVAASVPAHGLMLCAEIVQPFGKHELECALQFP